MDLDAIKEGIVTHVYHIPPDKTVPLHKHNNKDEGFYCIKGSGFGALEDREVELTPGDSFIVPAGVMHSLRSDAELFVCAFLIPALNER